MPEPAVAQVRESLQPKLEALVQHMGATDNVQGLVFFTDLLVELCAAEVESDLLRWCIELSKAAFVGIGYDDPGWSMTDSILAEAELIAQTFLADEGAGH